MNEQVQTMLIQVAEKLGTTAEHLWGVLVKQARIDGYVNLLVYILLPFGIFLYFKWLKYHQKNESSLCDFTEFGRVFITGAGGILVLVFSMFAILSISETISCFYNPEYVALNDLLQMLKSNK